MRQLAAEGLPSLVARLVGRRHYLLAMRICQALGLSTEEVGEGRDLLHVLTSGLPCTRWHA